MKLIVSLVVVLACALAWPVDVNLGDDEAVGIDTVENVVEENVENAYDNVEKKDDVVENADDNVDNPEDNLDNPEDNVDNPEDNVENADVKSAVAEQVGGMIEIAQSRVVNGNATTIEHFPWIVSMQYYGSHRCGGSIITTNRILTAAHCTINISPSSLSIRAGSTDSQTGGELVAVTEFTNHQSYNPTTLENDISVMVIATRLVTGANIAVIPLPMHGATVPDGVVADVAGWGALCEKCPGISTLQYVGLPVLSNAQCSLMYGETVTPGMLCAGFVEGGRDACQGDSGGPLNFGNVLIGLVSWGEGCARPNSPGVFTKVSFYRNWINGLL